MSISATAASARESARHSNGRFGGQARTDPGQLSLDDDGGGTFWSEHARRVRRVETLYETGSSSDVTAACLQVVSHVYRERHPGARYLALDDDGSGVYVADVLDAQGRRLSRSVESDAAMVDADVMVSNVRAVPDGFRGDGGVPAGTANLVDLDVVERWRPAPPGIEQLDRDMREARRRAAAAAADAERAEMALLAGHVRRRFPDADALVYEARAGDEARLVGVRTGGGVRPWHSAALGPAGRVRVSTLTGGGGTTRVVPFSGLA